EMSEYQTLTVLSGKTLYDNFSVSKTVFLTLFTPASSIAPMGCQRFLMCGSAQFVRLILPFLLCAMARLPPFNVFYRGFIKHQKHVFKTNFYACLNSIRAQKNYYVISSS